MHSYIHISLSFSLYTIYILYIIYLQYMHMGYKPHATCVAPLCAAAPSFVAPKHSSCRFRPSKMGMSWDFQLIYDS